MFDRFTDNARKSMGLARLSVQQFHQDFIGTEHLLLGLIDAGGRASTLIGERPIPRLLQEQLEQGTSSVTQGQIPFTPDAKKALENALEVASASGHSYIGTLHVLAGVARVQQGPSHSILQSTGPTLEEIEAALRLAPREDPTAGGGFHLGRKDIHSNKRRWMLLLIVLNVIVLLGQIWPEEAPPFARAVNIVFLSASLLWFITAVRKQ